MGLFQTETKNYFFLHAVLLQLVDVCVVIKIKTLKVTGLNVCGQVSHQQTEILECTDCTVMKHSADNKVMTFGFMVDESRDLLCLL